MPPVVINRTFLVPESGVKVIFPATDVSIVIALAAATVPNETLPELDVPMKYNPHRADDESMIAMMPLYPLPILIVVPDVLTPVFLVRTTPPILLFCQRITETSK